MSSLNHVKMWTKHGYEPTTVKEADRQHPGGTVPATSGFFICDLCGQYVTFTARGAYARHFRHNSMEDDKNCPERSSISSVFTLENNVLPLKISEISASGFSLSIGFPPMKKDQPADLDKHRIIIIPSSGARQRYEYSINRLNPDSITYLSVGSVPCQNYRLVLDKSIFGGYPSVVSGISNPGTVFDTCSGRIISYDGEVQIGRQYYLVTREAYIPFGCVKIERICSSAGWYVYIIEAKEMTINAAGFFLRYHCRLVEQAAEIKTLFPLYVESQLFRQYAQIPLIIKVNGNGISLRSFPATIPKSYPENIFRIVPNERQQLIAAGRFRMLQYAYFLRDPLDQVAETPVVEVTDAKGHTIANGENRTPVDGTIRVLSQYDGWVLVRKNGRIQENKSLKASEPLYISEIKSGTEVIAKIGMDKVFSSIFVHAQKTVKHDKYNLLQRLRNCHGRQIMFDMRSCQMLYVLDDYPEVRKWIEQKRIDGKIPCDAVELLYRFNRKQNY